MSVTMLQLQDVGKTFRVGAFGVFPQRGPYHLLAAHEEGGLDLILGEQVKHDRRRRHRPVIEGQRELE